MKRLIWIALAALVVVAAGVTLVAVPRGQEWTTSSPEALAEFEAGTDAQNKIYYAEAQEHFGRAFELDPDFVMAKWRYAGLLYDDDRERAARRRIDDRCVRPHEDESGDDDRPCAAQPDERLRASE